jgi:hypothetical protein
VPLLIEEVLASPGVPSSFADTVRERLGVFAAQERVVIDGAAVLGRIFDWRLLAPMTEVTSEFAGDVLAGGIDRQILSSDGTSFRFRHALTREAVLSVVLPPRQQALVLAGDQTPPIYDPQADPEGPDGGFELAEGATPGEALATWREKYGTDLAALLDNLAAIQAMRRRRRRRRRRGVSAATLRTPAHRIGRTRHAWAT